MNGDINVCISQIERLLSQRCYDEISVLFTDEFMRDIDCDELAYLSLYVLVYREERAAGIVNTSLSYGSNIAELIEVFRGLKFYLWELEFNTSEDDIDLSKAIKVFIESYGITVQFMKMVVMTSSVNKELVIKRLSNIL